MCVCTYIKFVKLLRSIRKYIVKQHDYIERMTCVNASLSDCTHLSLYICTYIRMLTDKLRRTKCCISEVLGITLWFITSLFPCRGLASLILSKCIIKC